MGKTERPIVDDADVDRIVEGVLHSSDLRGAAPEARAEIAYRFALDIASDGFSLEWAEELARRVRQRALWAKP
jgi:hypothetical protein